MKLSREFIKGLIREQLTVVPEPEERLKQEVDLFEKRSDELEAISSSLTGMGQYFQGVYPDFDSDLADILASVSEFQDKLDSKIEELKNAE
tara:strand:+ start:2762 stop:3034 length:273 start_codon:yes stop_codon:yes gene_type:complete